MKTQYQEFIVHIPSLDGKTVAETIPVQVPQRWDEDLQTWILTEEAHTLIEDTKARHMGLLLPYQLKELRERHFLTQKEMGELFQVGEKSWSRWESGRQRPSRVINLIIMALYDGEISIEYLKRKKDQEVSTDHGRIFARFYGATADHVATATLAPERHSGRRIIFMHSSPSLEDIAAWFNRTGQINKRTKSEYVWH